LRKSKTYQIYVVSDGTGGTAERALNAALLQFEGAKIEIVRRSGVRTEKEVQKIVNEVGRVGGFIVHTLVTDKLRQEILHSGRIENVETIDLMGPLLERLSRKFSISPVEKPGLFQQLNEEYFRRVETMEFAFRHDDGQRIEDLERAEIILVGVSRTFKTPLSIYLAFKGWLVANVPVVMNMELPAVLFELPAKRIFALKSDPYRLASLRRVRHERLSGATGDYADPNFVIKEMDYALRIFKRQANWQIIDVTSKPIEEIASEILTLVAKSQKNEHT
jgi:regulator of PEP synthase PpsR (kinase-PPPase family)